MSNSYYNDLEWEGIVDHAVFVAVAAERERCAAICERLAKTYENLNYRAMGALEYAAAAIRKGEEP